MRFTYTEWIPVTSRVPNTPIPVLVFIRDERLGVEMRIATYRDKEWFIENDYANHITHWTKLPKAPA